MGPLTELREAYTVYIYIYIYGFSDSFEKHIRYIYVYIYIYMCPLTELREAYKIYIYIYIYIYIHIYVSSDRASRSIPKIASVRQHVSFISIHFKHYFNNEICEFMYSYFYSTDKF